MTDDVLVRHCAPTLAGRKTGSLFSCTFSDQTTMCFAVRRWNLLLRKCGLRVLPLRHQNERWLIYVYRPALLRLDLSIPAAQLLLRERGYRSVLEIDCLRRVMHRLQTSAIFPHEIGLFLGYPTEDVRGFIEKGPQRSKYTGAWRVYGDVAEAKRRFAIFDHCKAVCCAKLHAGASIDRIAVTD